jgi:hypothetical protein
MSTIRESLPPGPPYVSVVARPATSVIDVSFPFGSAMFVPSVS